MLGGAKARTVGGGAGSSNDDVEQIFRLASDGSELLSRERYAAFTRLTESRDVDDGRWKQHCAALGVVEPAQGIDIGAFRRLYSSGFRRHHGREAADLDMLVALRGERRANAPVPNRHARAVAVARDQRARSGSRGGSVRQADWSLWQWAGGPQQPPPSRAGCIGALRVIAGLPRRRSALQLLQLAARHAEPVLRRRGWRVGCVQEFLPARASLEGMNQNGGKVILLRLREERASPERFIGLPSVLLTLLHEIAHIQVTPHNGEFFALLSEMVGEVQAGCPQVHTSYIRQRTLAWACAGCVCNNANGPCRIDRAGLGQLLGR
eukprot:COSAG01_NODE_3689_length_5793_cov_1.991394_2_plen_322_part_00